MNLSEERITIRKADISEAEEIYNRFITEDFPDDERKPFAVIRKTMEENTCDFYAAMFGSGIAGYAVIAVKREKGGDEGHLALLDYFAVRKDLSGKGFGRRILRELMKKEMPCDYLVIESETPESAADPEEEETRRRRIRFYTGCGAVHTGVVTRLWHVDYDMLILPKHPEEISDDKARRMTEEMYRFMYPARWFGNLLRITMREG